MMKYRVMIHCVKGLALLCAAILQTAAYCLFFGGAVAAIVAGVQLLAAAVIVYCRIRAPD